MMNRKIKSIMSRFIYTRRHGFREKKVVEKVSRKFISTHVNSRVLLVLAAAPIFILAIFVGTVISAIFFGAGEP